MASIGEDTGGRKRILFVAGDGKRKTVRLGKATNKQADAFKVKVESLITGGITGNMDDETARWVAGLDDAMHARLAAVGLVKARQATTGNGIAAFIDHFIAGRKASMKEHTRLNWIQVRQWLVKHFGESKDMRTITPADAEDWATFMTTDGLGQNTIRRHIGRARQLFKAAIRRGVVRGANPFDGMTATVRADKSRAFFVTREVVAKVTDACPDAEWRFMVALSRYGGIRTPSETLALKWADVDWDRQRIRVPSPKTEHHEGKDERIIPLFPELRAPLLEVFAAAPEGTQHVITRYRDKYANVRTQLARIIRKAGLTVWAKPWHNMRATRQTELADQYPIHVVCAWIGNSRAVAQEHYLQVTDSHFDAATAEPLSAAQNAAQYPAVTSRTGQEVAAAIVGNQPDLRESTTGCDTLRNPNYPRQDSNL